LLFRQTGQRNRSFLALPVAELPDYFLVEQRYRVLKKLELFIQKNEVCKLFACLNYIMNVDCVDKVIIGIQSKAELESIFKIIESNGFRDRMMFEGQNSNQIDLIDPRSWDY
jgi:hypothetical protein